MKSLLILASIVAVVPLPQGVGQPVKGVIKGNGAGTDHIAQKAQQEDKSAESEAIRGILAQVTKIQEQNAKVIKTAETQDNQNADINRKIEIYTRDLVIVGFIQALILAATVWAVKRQADLQQATLQQWVHFSDWKAAFASENQRWLNIQFGVVNPTAYPLTVTKFEIFIGLPGIPSLSPFTPKLRILPHEPQPVTLTIPITEEEAERFQTGWLEFGIGGKIIHTDMGPNKLTLMPISGRLMCHHGSNDGRAIFIGPATATAKA